MIDIIEIKKSELNSIIPLCEEFSKVAKQNLVAIDFINNLNILMDNGMCSVFIAKNENKIIGVIGGLLSNDLFNNELYSLELFWFVSEEDRGCGIKLFKKFEEWSIKNNAKKIVFAHLPNIMPDKLKSFYKKSGYKESETHFSKEVI